MEAHGEGLGEAEAPPTPAEMVAGDLDMPGAEEETTQEVVTPGVEAERAAERAAEEAAEQHAIASRQDLSGRFAALQEGMEAMEGGSAGPPAPTGSPLVGPRRTRRLREVEEKDPPGPSDADAAAQVVAAEVGGAGGADQDRRDEAAGLRREATEARADIRTRIREAAQKANLPDPPTAGHQPSGTRLQGQASGAAQTSSASSNSVGTSSSSSGRRSAAAAAAAGKRTSRG